MDIQALGDWVLLPYIHLSAALLWVGSMLFLALVLMPAMRQGAEPAKRQALMRAIAPRYRLLGWGSVGVLLLTGLLLLWQHGVVWHSDFGHVLIIKLVFVVLMLAMTLYHDRVLGPQATRTLTEKQGPGAVSKRSARLARTNLLLVLVIIFCGLSLMVL